MEILILVLMLQVNNPRDLGLEPGSRTPEELGFESEAIIDPAKPPLLRLDEHHDKTPGVTRQITRQWWASPSDGPITYCILQKGKSYYVYGRSYQPEFFYNLDPKKPIKKYRTYTDARAYIEDFRIRERDSRNTNHPLHIPREKRQAVRP